MKLLVIGHDDFSRPSTWSGIPYYMLAGLRRQGFEIISAYPIRAKATPLHRTLEWSSRAIRKILQRMPGLGNRATAIPLWFVRYTRPYAANVACAIDAQVAQTQPDAVLAIITPEVGLCQFTQPLVYTSDGTFAACEGYYDWFSNWAHPIRAQARNSEIATLRKARWVIYPSYWARNSAINDYGIASGKLHVVEYGANFGIDTALLTTSAPTENEVRLLFVAVEQYRKGLDTVLATQSVLVEMGVRAYLDIVGCKVTLPIPHPQFTTVHGFLSKSNTQQAERLRQIYAQAHLFFVPSRAEAYGIVYCEAAALGLPVLARATGGVETIVQNGKTGVLLPPTAPISDYRDTILSLLRPNQPATAITPYTEMRQYARQRYEQVLNWDIFAQRVKNLLDSA